MGINLRLGIGVVSVAILTGCSSDGSEPKAAQSSMVTETAVATPHMTSSIESPSSDTEYPDSALPSGIDADSDAALLWTALMSPDGEYAASAAYQAVIVEFGAVEPYVTIQAAEERHISALVRQLNRFGVEVPENPYLGKIEAPKDLTAAARAWATGEIDNVAMYDDLLAKAEDANAIRVLTNLRRSSQESHLPMFNAAAENGGILDKDEMALLGGH